LEKVKVSREVAEAIERVKAECESVEVVIKHLSLNDDSQSDYKILSDIPFKVLISALVNGYETEMTPEQSVVKLFKESLEKYRDAQSRIDLDYFDGFTDGIREVLDLLNIKIEGVND